VPDDALSRRALFRLDFGRTRAPRPDPAPFKAGLSWRWHAGADALLRAWEPLAPVLCDVAAIAPGDHVLDAATGDGNVALEAARRGAAVTGVDLVSAQVTRARERAEAAGLDVRLRTGDIEDLDDLDGEYDAVLSAFGATLAPRPRLAVRELLRVLRPGGLLVLAAPAPHSLADRVLEWAQDGPGERPRGIPSPAAWGREDIVRERIEAVAPGTEVELRTHPLWLEFGSEEAAWLAYSGPFGLPAGARDDFADLVAARSDSLAHVEMEEPVTLVLARRPG
jgi:SAM-dependent methyltransferase